MPVELMQFLYKSFIALFIIRVPGSNKCVCRVRVNIYCARGVIACHGHVSAFVISRGEGPGRSSWQRGPCQSRPNTNRPPTFHNQRQAYKLTNTLMKLERFVTMVFDLQHKFVGRNPLSKVFFRTFQEFNLLPSSGVGSVVRTTVFFIIIVI